MPQQQWRREERCRAERGVQSRKRGAEQKAGCRAESGAQTAREARKTAAPYRSTRVSKASSKATRENSVSSAMAWHTGCTDASLASGNVNRL